MTSTAQRSAPTTEESRRRPQLSVVPAPSARPLGANMTAGASLYPAGLAPRTRPARAADRRVQRRWGIAALVAADTVMIGIAMVIAFVVRQVALGRAGDLSATVFDAAGLIGLGWIAAIAISGAYATRLVATGTKMFHLIIQSSFAAAGIVAAGVYLLNIELSRVFFVVFFVVGPILLLLERYAARKILGHIRRSGRFRTTVIAVGPLSHVDGIARVLGREGWLGYDVIGALTPEGDPRRRSAQDIPVLGHEEDLLEIIHREQPGVLLFTAGATGTAEQFRRTAWKLEDHAIDVIVAPAMTDIAPDRVELRPVAGLPLVHMDRPRAQDSLRWTKRAFDVVASGLGLLLIAPLMLVIAGIVKVHDGGPVLFRQQRVGRNGETFEFLKFRSMVTNAEEVLEEIRRTGAQDKGNDILFKMRHDPRVTGPGRILRRYSLDELPQLINVLRGDMSLVGPRPALPHEVRAYDEDAHRRLSVRPGITGLWQVSGRSELSWDETVRLDLYYVDNWSFMQDAQILFRTGRAVVASRGAY